MREFTYKDIIYFLFETEKVIGRIYRKLYSWYRLLYFGLFYFFTCAGYVSLRDEMFYTSLPSKLYIQSYSATESVVMDSAVKGDRPSDIYKSAFFNICGQRRNHEALLAIYSAVCENIRSIMQAAKELPERHRVRLRFCSD
jgi:hypothetical protein